ncbi:uncharacterized protein LOC128174032 [Crassostrea angulata]|uniref:uncharacterized protein LOC128174032 n=1 Tax=Magallana angulata TaxID=2784310 RepID=UPI0022B1323F|nr:uncharacterized protein LOC128174032 [Crassostrea angulata]
MADSSKLGAECRKNPKVQKPEETDQKKHQSTFHGVKDRQTDKENVKELDKEKLLIVIPENEMTNSSNADRQTDKENVKELDEKEPLIEVPENEMTNSSNAESQIDEAIFDQWKQEDSCFISTKACEEVEKNIESSNLVIVAGHSGSGKSAIMQHIALKYREQGWAIKRVKQVKDIVAEYSSSRFKKDKTICVFNDPLGKESFDEILNNSWQTYEEELKLYLRTAKLLMSCRSHIISDARLTRYLNNQSLIVNIDENKYK